MFRTMIAVAAIVCGLHAPLLARGEEGTPAQPPRFEGPYADESDLMANCVNERVKKIDAELKTLDRSKLDEANWAREWAGTYCFNSGYTGVTISVAPEAGVAYSWNGCGCYWGNYGDIVEATAESLKVKWAFDPEKASQRFLSEELYFVRWGNRRYLVPRLQMGPFTSYYNQGGMMRSWMFDIPEQFQGKRTPRFLPGDRPAPPGRPQLPARFVKFIIEKPTRLKIVKVSGTHAENPYGAEYLTADVELEGGSDQGIYRGLTVEGGKDSNGASLVVTEAGAQASSGRLLMFVEKGARFPGPGYEFALPGAAPEAKE